MFVAVSLSQPVGWADFQQIVPASFMAQDNVRSLTKDRLTIYEVRALLLACYEGAPINGRRARKAIGSEQGALGWSDTSLEGYI